MLTESRDFHRIHFDHRTKELGESQTKTKPKKENHIDSNLLINETTCLITVPVHFDNNLKISLVRKFNLYYAVRSLSS